MKEKITNAIHWVLGKNISSDAVKSVNVNNINIKLKQVKILLAAVLIGGFIIGATVLFIKSKSVKKVKKVVFNS